MKLETYKSLSEKEKIFKSNGYSKIDTVAEFDRWYESFPKIDKIYRGVNEAKFKIYTSAQRSYITNDLQTSGKMVENIIEEELNQIKTVDDNLLKKYFDLLGVVDYDLIYLSFLQHYSGISPLIDFSVDIDKSLFFMQDGLFFSKSGDEEISNYASLYYMESKDESNIDVPNDMTESIIREKTTFSTMSLETEPIIIQSQKYNFGNKSKLSLANLNLVAQEGRFVFYCNDIKPLEEGIYCVDIHKSLAPYIKGKLEGKGITKESIYPQEESIAKKALQRALENI